MARVMAVTFETHGQLHYLDPGVQSYRVGDHVLYPTEFGSEVAQVVWAPEQVDSQNLTGLPVCEGIASEADLVRDAENRRRRAEALVVARALVAEHDLPMKVVAVDWIDRSSDFDKMAAIYFTAPGRVDFRALIGALARALNARIDLRQVASRDAARLQGGIGSCGRDLCCSTWLKDFEPVGMRLAKVQNLSPNPLAIQGQCGKLMCCLKYEHPLYVDFAKQAPAVGSRVDSPIGEGTVIGHSVPGQSITVRNGQGEVQRCPLTEVCVTSRRRKARDEELREHSDQPAVPHPPVLSSPGLRRTTDRPVGAERRTATGPTDSGPAGSAPAAPAPDEAPEGRVKKARHKKRTGFAGRKPPTGPQDIRRDTHHEPEDER